MRDLANSVCIPPVDASYASPLAWGWDTWQETWKLRPTDRLARELDDAKQHAKAFSTEGRGYAQFVLNGRSMVIRSEGAKGGVKWVLEDSNILILIRANNDWGVTVRFLSAGLWSCGLDDLRSDVLSLLSQWGFDDGGEAAEPRVSRADYAVDFQSIAFEREFSPDIVESIITHHKKKVSCTMKQGAFKETDVEFWMKGGRVETLTIGRMPGLQLQVYNKSQEITDISGKEWMRDLWSRSELYAEEAPVWRFEIRFTKNFLKDRNATDWGAVIASRRMLISEALFKNRLVVQKINGETTANVDKSKWDLHPLWALMLAIEGKKKCFRWGGRSLAGVRRSLSVLFRRLLARLEALPSLRAGNLVRQI